MFLKKSKMICKSNATNLLACRRLLDIEGWASDMTMLRQQLAATNRKLQQMRLTSRLPGLTLARRHFKHLVAHRG